MSKYFQSVRISQIIRETEDCVSICFDADTNAAFKYLEGQNITVRKTINGEEIRRSYSVCNAPYEGVLKIAIKQVDGGLFSTFANNALKEGDVLDIMPPTGKFNAHLDTKRNHYLAIAAGSGITPVISIIKHTLHTQPDSRFTIIYGNRKRSSIIFFEELENLKNRYMDRLNLIHILSREKTNASLNYGRIDEEKLSELAKVINYTELGAAYLCGPESMIFSSATFLEKSGLEKSRIHFELFTTPGETKKNKKEIIATEEETGPKSKVTIKLDGRSFSFDLSYNGNNVLDAALQQGADLPYACKGGVCCTCKAQLLEGNVKMDLNYALEEEEIEQGYILTCQAHPTSDKVVIDFDVK